MKYAKINTETTYDLTGERKGDMGIDFYVPKDWNGGKPYILRIGEQVTIDMNIKTKFKDDLGLVFLNKSGAATKKGIIMGAQCIDASYQGNILNNFFKVVKGCNDIRVRRKGFLGLLGFKEWATTITHGEKMAQGVLIKISTEEVNEITLKSYNRAPRTKRADGGFGSTGTNVKEKIKNKSK